LTFSKKYGILQLRGEKKMKIKYKTLDLRFEENFDKAERLQARGWKIGSAGLYTIQLYKEIKNEK
jgi:hypothetical protein